jgi:glycosyltransferase involved in cell wall biosynthesis
MSLGKRICIIADSVDEFYGGISIYSKELIRNLLLFDKINRYHFVHFKENPFFKNLEHTLIKKSNSILGEFYRKFYLLPKFLKEKKFDLIHDLYHISSLIVNDIPGKKVITIHDLTPILFPNYHPFTRYLKHKLFLGATLKKMDFIITDSFSTKKDIEKNFVLSNPIRTVYLGSRKLVPIEEENSSVPYILTVGNLEPRKNIETLLKAFYIIKEKGREEQLYIIGSKGWSNKKLFSEITNSKYSSDIKVFENISDNKLGWFYKNSSVFVYPSFYEGFGLPILEAMSYGCPIIASNVSSIPEIVEGYGLLFKPENTEALAESILDVLQNKNLSEKLSLKSLKRVNDFSWENTASETINVYKEVMAIK